MRRFDLRGHILLFGVGQRAVLSLPYGYNADRGPGRLSRFKALRFIDLLFMCVVRGRARRGGAAARAARGNPLCMRIVMGDGVKVKAVRRLQKYDAYTMWVYI
jgi:hypothetical protein